MIVAKSFVERFFIIFSIGFVISFPFPFFVIPNVGGFLATYFISINQFWGGLFNVDSVGTVFEIVSDSTGLYLHLINLLIFSSGLSLIWIVKSKVIHPNIKRYFRIGIAYYLALILFKYGFDKIFKHQFYFPEPNTLYTPLNQLSKDILFWSSMGTSYLYSVFSGLIEVIPACFLLFRKTRLLGGLIAMAVLINVVMLNFGFDISVKVFSIFLLLLAFFIISKDSKRLYHVFTNQKVDGIKDNVFVLQSKNDLLKYALVKSLVICLFLFESIGPYVKIQNFNDDNSIKPYLFGAYDVVNHKKDSKSIKRVFFHKQQYFITQLMDDSFESYKVQFSADLSKIYLTNSFHESKIMSLDIKYNKSSKILRIDGVFNQKEIHLQTEKIDLSTLPISNDSYMWNFDGYIK